MDRSMRAEVSFGRARTAARARQHDGDRGGGYGDGDGDGYGGGDDDERDQGRRWRGSGESNGGTCITAVANEASGAGVRAMFGADAYDSDAGSDVSNRSSMSASYLIPGAPIPPRLLQDRKGQHQTAAAAASDDNAVEDGDALLPPPLQQQQQHEEEVTPQARALGGDVRQGKGQVASRHPGSQRFNIEGLRSAIARIDAEDDRQADQDACEHRIVPDSSSSGSSGSSSSRGESGEASRGLGAKGRSLSDPSSASPHRKDAHSTTQPPSPPAVDGANGVTPPGDVRGGRPSNTHGSHAVNGGAVDGSKRPGDGGCVSVLASTPTVCVVAPNNDDSDSGSEFEL